MSEIRMLPVVLSEEELSVRARELAEKIRELEEHETARKEAARQLKEEEDALQSEVSALARVVRDGAEKREVVCRWARNDERHMMELVRDDTGTVVEYRQMTQSELTRPLPFANHA